MNLQQHTRPSLQEFTPLAAQLKAVNLGQGFPDWPTPAFCKEAAKRAIDADFNQVRGSHSHTLALLVAPWCKMRA